MNSKTTPRRGKRTLPRIVRHSMSAEDIATKLALALFDLGNNPGNPCIRIEFKGGTSFNETANGGMCLPALSSFLANELTKILPNASHQRAAESGTLNGLVGNSGGDK